MHARKKIKHNVANLRLWQKPPPKLSEGEIKHDEMQELRITQYEQYIQEKLGLFRKPNAYDLMLFNFEKDKRSFLEKHSDSNHSATASILKEKILTERNKCQTESPQRLLKVPKLESLSSRKVKISATDHNLDTHNISGNHNIHKTEIFSSDYDDITQTKQREYIKVSEKINRRRNILAHTADKDDLRIRIKRGRRNEMYDSKQNIKHAINFANMSLQEDENRLTSTSIFQHSKQNSKRNKFLSNWEQKNSKRNMNSTDRIRLKVNDSTSLQWLKETLKRNKIKRNKKILKINSKIMNIFQDPEIDKSAIDRASIKSQESLNSLYKIQIKQSLLKKKKNEEAHLQTQKPKEKFESLMRRILDRGANM